MGRISITPKRLAAVLTILGAAVAVGGVALVYVPAALILGGASLAGIGLFVVEVDQ